VAADTKEEQITISPHVHRLLVNYCNKTGKPLNEDTLSDLVAEQAAHVFGVDRLDNHD